MREKRDGLTDEEWHAAMMGDGPPGFKVQHWGVPRPGTWDDWSRFAAHRMDNSAAGRMLR